MTFEELKKEYANKFNESPKRLNFHFTEEEYIKMWSYCIKNNVTMDYFTKYKKGVIY